MFSTLEPCWTFALRWREGSHVQSPRRKCLFLYYYFMDCEFGLIHVRIQTWFPIQIQVYDAFTFSTLTPAPWQTSVRRLR